MTFRLSFWSYSKNLWDSEVNFIINSKSIIEKNELKIRYKQMRFNLVNLNRYLSCLSSQFAMESLLSDYKSLCREREDVSITRMMTLGPFIREKISRGLHKTRTPRINGTKSTFTAFSSRGLSWPGS